jgi:hypothetical protein
VSASWSFPGKLLGQLPQQFVVSAVLFAPVCCCSLFVLSTSMPIL